MWSGAAPEVSVLSSHSNKSVFVSATKTRWQTLSGFPRKPIVWLFDHGRMVFYTCLWHLYNMPSLPVIVSGTSLWFPWLQADSAGCLLWDGRAPIPDRWEQLQLVESSRNESWDPRPKDFSNEGLYFLFFSDVLERRQGRFPDSTELKQGFRLYRIDMLSCVVQFHIRAQEWLEMLSVRQKTEISHVLQFASPSLYVHWLHVYW